MRFFDKIKLSSQAIKSIFSLKNPGPLQKWAADLLGTEENSITKPYAQSIWIYRCLSIWQRVSKIPMVCYDKDGNVVSDSAISYLFNRPQSKKSFSELMDQTILSLGLTGEYFILKEDGYYEGTEPKYLTPVWPTIMSIEPQDINQTNGMVERWTIKLSSGMSKKIPASGVIHDKMFNPYNPYRGLSPVESGRASVDSDYAARQHNRYMMQRHGRVSNMITFKEDLTEEQMNLYAQKWREKYEGNENAGATVFLGGGANMTQLALSMKDLDWLEGMKLTREEICAIYGIPPNNAGILDKATYSNFEQSTLTLWQDTLIPLGDKVAQKLTIDLVEPSEGIGAYCAFDWENNVPCLQASINLKIDRYAKLIASKISPKRAAEITGIDLGEIQPAHEMIWVTMSEVPVDSVLDYENGNNEESKETEEVKNNPFTTLRNLARTMKPIESKSCSCHDDSKSIDSTKPEDKINYERKQILGKSIVKDSYEFERIIGLAVKRHFWEQRKVILSNAEKVFRKATANYKSIETKGEAMTTTEMANELFGDEDWNEQLIARLKKPIRSAFLKGVKQVEKEGRFSPDLFSESMFNSYMKETNTLLKKVNDYTKDAVERVCGSVLENVQTGGTTSELMDKFKDDLKGVMNNTESRRRTIARTESLRAINGGRYEEMKVAGVKTKEWVAVIDGATRDSHIELDGNTIPIGEEFTIKDGPNSGSTIDFPLDPNAPAGDTINCRCTLIMGEE